MRIAATTILYNPAANYLENIRSYAGLVEKVYIIDNSEFPPECRQEEISSIGNATLILNNQNLGIAKALNQGIKLAMADGFDWVLTMDQDSSFDGDNFQNYLASLEKLDDSENAAVTGVVYEPGKLKVPEKITSANMLITSGSFINIEIFKRLGGYLEKLFIDEVDHEYCFRAKLAGYQVLLFEHIFLKHNLGESREVNNLMKNRKIKRNIHSSTRLYYIIRNTIYLKSNYAKSFPEEITTLQKDVLIRIKNRLLYADRKFYSLRLIFLGIYHSLIGRYGKL